MKPNKLILSIAGILLASSAYVTPSVAYAEGGDHKEASKADSKEHEEAKSKDSEELTQGIPHAVTLSNLSTWTLKEIDIKFSGKDRGDFRQTNNCGEELKSKASCTISVTFMPKSPGTKTAMMEVRTSGGNQAVYLTGTGI